jgi:hypothetical protein
VNLKASMFQPGRKHVLTKLSSSLHDSGAAFRYYSICSSKVSARLTSILEASPFSAGLCPWKIFLSRSYRWSSSISIVQLDEASSSKEKNYSSHVTSIECSGKLSRTFQFENYMRSFFGVAMHSDGYDRLRDLHVNTDAAKGTIGGLQRMVLSSLNRNKTAFSSIRLWSVWLRQAQTAIYWRMEGFRGIQENHKEKLRGKQKFNHREIFGASEACKRGRGSWKKGRLA